MIFQPFPKMPRLSREVIVTEKIDGTNASVFICPADGPPPMDEKACAQIGDLVIYAGSRTRWITPPDDNFGFARWVCEHAEELIHLGPGHHFGEWWGQGIQRKYGMKEKRFSLFNTARWCLHDQEPQQIPTGDPRIIKLQDILPPCCHLVPELWRGEFCTRRIQAVLDRLMIQGSVAAPGFKDPEGIVIFHTAANMAFKKTIHGDDHPKSMS